MRRLAPPLGPPSASPVESRPQHHRTASVLAAALLLAACSPSTSTAPSPDPSSAREVSPQPGSTTGIALTVDCRQYPRPNTVEDLDRLSTSYLGHPGFLGGDGAMSAALSDGRHLALFGDTWRAPTYPGGEFVRNSMIVFSSDQACIVTAPQGTAPIPDRGDGVGYWPMSLIVDATPEGDLVWIMAQRVVATATDDLGFAVLGSSVVRLRIPHGGAPELIDVRDVSPDDPSARRITWGAAMWRTGGWVQVYGTSNPDTPGVFGWALHAARARIADLDAPRRWQYWDGVRWQSDPDLAADIIGALGGVAQVLSVFERHGSWFAVSTRDGDLGDEVVVWRAPTSTGPFASPTPLVQLPADGTGGINSYLALAHPELFPQTGTMVLSYSQGPQCTEPGCAPALDYRPRFLRVALPQ